MKKVTSSKDMPLTGVPQWAVLQYRSIYIPGDERSRTNPGHGYPESTERVSDLLVFDSEEELKSWLERHTREDVIVLKAQRVDAKSRIVIDLG